MAADAAAVLHQLPVVRVQDKGRAGMLCDLLCRKGVVKVAVGQNHIFDADAELVHFLQDFVGRRAGVYDKADVGRIGFDHIAVCLYGSHFQS